MHLCVFTARWNVFIHVLSWLHRMSCCMYHFTICSFLNMLFIPSCCCQSVHGIPTPHFIHPCLYGWTFKCFQFSFIINNTTINMLIHTHFSRAVPQKYIHFVELQLVPGTKCILILLGTTKSSNLPIPVFILLEVPKQPFPYNLPAPKIRKVLPIWYTNCIYFKKW